jgi:hypothetical protein
MGSIGEDGPAQETGNTPRGAHDLDRSDLDSGGTAESTQLRCSACKNPVALEGGHGQRRAALLEDWLTLCDVCAPAGNMQHSGHGRWHDRV